MLPSVMFRAAISGSNAERTTTRPCPRCRIVASVRSAPLGGARVIARVSISHSRRGSHPAPPYVEFAPHTPETRSTLTLTQSVSSTVYVVHMPPRKKPPCWYLQGFHPFDFFSVFVTNALAPRETSTKFSGVSDVRTSLDSLRARVASGEYARTKTSRGVVRYSKTARSCSGVKTGVACSRVSSPSVSFAFSSTSSPHPSAGNPKVSFPRNPGIAISSSKLPSSNAIGK
mmetsp:Transcript_13554/g.50742  ORF Transcript_13554/g.50742 Transcript_13554/m.50742 type:complete len:229 (+) Transcript_13554:7365-8051(+)